MYYKQFYFHKTNILVYLTCTFANFTEDLKSRFTYMLHRSLSLDIQLMILTSGEEFYDFDLISET